MSKKKITKAPVYLVWNEVDEYFEQYDSLKDAVENSDDSEVPVFKAIPELIGTYTLKNTVVKVKES